MVGKSAKDEGMLTAWQYESLVSECSSIQTGAVKALEKDAKEFKSYPSSVLLGCVVEHCRHT